MGCSESNEVPSQPAPKGSRNGNVTQKQSVKNESKKDMKDSKNTSPSKPISNSKINTSRSVPKTTKY